MCCSQRNSCFLVNMQVLSLTRLLSYSLRDSENNLALEMDIPQKGRYICSTWATNRRRKNSALADMEIIKKVQWQLSGEAEHFDYVLSKRAPVDEAVDQNSTSQHASVSIFSKCRAQTERQPSLSYIQSSILDSLISTNPNLWLKLLSRGFTAPWSRPPFPSIILFCHLVVRCLHPLRALFPLCLADLSS